MNVCVESIPCAWKSDKAIDKFKVSTWLQCNLQLKEHGSPVYFFVWFIRWDVKVNITIIACFVFNRIYDSDLKIKSLEWYHVSYKINLHPRCHVYCEDIDNLFLITIFLAIHKWRNSYNSTFIFSLIYFYALSSQNHPTTPYPTSHIFCKLIILKV